jgi:hypothetical protein
MMMPDSPGMSQLFLLRNEKIGKKIIHDKHPADPTFATATNIAGLHISKVANVGSLKQPIGIASRCPPRPNPKDTKCENQQSLIFSPLRPPV